MMAVSDTIDVQDLPEYLRSPVSGHVQLAHAELADGVTFDDHEKRLITDALLQVNGNQSEAARLLRIGRYALRYKMKKHRIEPPPFKKQAAM